MNDDLFTRLSKVAFWNTRQTEFGKEMPYAGRLSYGGTIIGPDGRPRRVIRAEPMVLSSPSRPRDGLPDAADELTS